MAYEYDTDLQKLMASDLPNLVKTDIKTFLDWQFNESCCENGTSFDILQRGCIYGAIGRIKQLGFCEDSIYAVEVGYVSILDWLTQNEYLLQEFVFPTSLYMKCLQTLILSLNKNCNQVAWFHLLPRKMQFHIIYFQELLWRARIVALSQLDVSGSE